MLWIVPFGIFPTLGWSLEVVRRRALKKVNLLPPLKLVQMCRRGFVICVFWQIYFTIPIFIIAFFFERTWLQLTWQLILNIWHIFTHQSQQSLATVFITYLLKLLSDAFAAVAYAAVASPMFLIARLRYAVTDRAGSFFRLIGNAAFFLFHPGEVLFYFFKSSCLRIVMLFLAGLLVSIPLLGQIATIILAAVGIWMRGYWAGAIATDMVPSGQVDLHSFSTGSGIVQEP